MAYGSIAAANSVLRRSFLNGARVNLMKLQKLLYLTAAQYVKLTGRALVDEQFQPWKYGPVLLSVHHKFSCFSGAPIDRYGTDAAGRVLAVQEASDSSLVAALNGVWAAGASLTAAQLARTTHAPGSAWDTAHRNSRPITPADMLADVTYLPLLRMTPARHA